ncbi:MAG: ribokinase [Acidimicrobiia bacterium]|nr:ribokinase [Acidimicrobiia bacterium]
MADAERTLEPMPPESSRPGPIEIAVVGSANVDLSIQVPRIPAPGETVLGGDTARGSGGKGANQAVAASRLGRRVAFVGRVGDDEGGLWLRERLEDDLVDVRALLSTRGVPTGMAVITVDPAGENSIVVAPGANRRVTPHDVNAADTILAEASVVLTQLEIPLDVVAALPSHTRGLLVLNPAPAQPGVALGDYDLVVPNRGELAVLAGADETPDLAVVADQARSLDTPVVVVTLGAQGAMVVRNEPDPLTGEAGGPQVVTLPALPVTAVDTTAAGDSFCGALAAALVEGATIVQAASWAVRVAGVTVTVRGAQDSLPHRAAVGSWED